VVSTGTSLYAGNVSLSGIEPRFAYATPAKCCKGRSRTEEEVVDYVKMWRDLKGARRAADYFERADLAGDGSRAHAGGSAKVDRQLNLEHQCWKISTFNRSKTSTWPP
jgi:hypothetical protein